MQKNLWQEVVFFFSRLPGDIVEGGLSWEKVLLGCQLHGSGDGTWGCRRVV